MARKYMYKGMVLNPALVVIDEETGKVEMPLSDGGTFVVPIAKFRAEADTFVMTKTIEVDDFFRKIGLIGEDEPVKKESSESSADA